MLIDASIDHVSNAAWDIIIHIYVHYLSEIHILTGYPVCLFV